MAPERATHSGRSHLRQDRYDTQFRVRIVLRNTGPASDTDMPMPWSSWMSSRKDAKQQAARVCLELLEETGAKPHDPRYTPPPLTGDSDQHGGGGMAGGGAAAAAAAPACATEPARCTKTTA